MRSPPPEGGRRLYVLRVGDDDPRPCTGRRLLLRGLASPWPTSGPPPGRVVLLDPHAADPLSAADRVDARVPSLAAIDCSWNGLAARGHFPVPIGRPAARRRLPWLLAANPQHFGRPTELNTVEALAAGLYLLGDRDRARALIEPFPGGRSFFPLNAPAIERFAQAPDAASIRELERAPAEGPTAPGSPGPRSPDARPGPRPGRPGP